MRRTFVQWQRVSMIVVAAFIFIAAPSPAGELLDINRASEAELQQLPGIGPARARAIVEHREQHGPFKTIDSLADVHGIGPAVLRSISDRITTSGEEVQSTPPAATSQSPSTQSDDDGFDLDLTKDGEPENEVFERASTPDGSDTGSSDLININTAEPSVLTLLPGVGPARAEAIISHRSAEGPFISIERITDVSGIGPATYRNIHDKITVRIDINEATVTDLVAVGVDKVSAGRIIDWIEEHGPVKATVQLSEDIGLDESLVATLEPILRFDD